jgi:hypothetical protein
MFLHSEDFLRPEMRKKKRRMVGEEKKWTMKKRKRGKKMTNRKRIPLMFSLNLNGVGNRTDHDDLCEWFGKEVRKIVSRAESFMMLN